MLQLYNLRLIKKSGGTISQMGSNAPVRSYVDHIPLVFLFLNNQKHVSIKKANALDSINSIMVPSHLLYWV